METSREKQIPVSNRSCNLKSVDQVIIKPIILISALKKTYKKFRKTVEWEKNNYKNPFTKYSELFL